MNDAIDFLCWRFPCWIGSGGGEGDAFPKASDDIGGGVTIEDDDNGCIIDDDVVIDVVDGVVADNVSVAVLAVVDDVLFFPSLINVSNFPIVVLDNFLVFIFFVDDDERGSSLSAFSFPYSLLW